MTHAGKNKKLNIHLADEEALLSLKTVLAYEASMRGLTIGQVSSELVSEAVDLDSYPPEVRGRLQEIAADAERRAVLKSLSLSED